MNQIEIDYRVVKADSGDIYESYATVGLTNKHIQEIAEYILADKDHQTGELQDIPHHIYDRISDAIVETAVRDMKEEGVPLYNDDDIAFQTYLPAMLIDLLPDEVVDVLPDFLFENEEEEEGEAEDGEEDDDDEGLTPEEEQQQREITTKEELFEYIGSYLSDEEKEEIVNGEPSDMHFGVGLLIRNIIVYPGIIKITELFDVNPLEIFHPDDASHFIIEEYQSYLKKQSEEATDNDDEEFEFPEPTKENTLYLTIKQVYFDQIMEGSKTEEYREIKETTYKKYLEVDEGGNMLFSLKAISEEELNSYSEADLLYIYNDGVCPLVPKENLWYLNLAVGYNKVRDTALVEVEGITFEVAKDKYGKPARFFAAEDGSITFDPNGNLCVWTAVLHLGKVVEKNIVTK